MINKGDNNKIKLYFKKTQNEINTKEKSISQEASDRKNARKKKGHPGTKKNKKKNSGRKNCDLS